MRRVARIEKENSAMNWKRIAKASFGASLLTAGFGCTAYDDWNSAAKTHRCTEAQMSKAQAEADWCKKNTDYLSTYCYGTAILRNCTRMTPNANVTGLALEWDKS